MSIAHRKELLSKEGRITEVAHLDGDDLHIETIEDCEPLVRQAKAMADIIDDNPPKHYRPAAVIPNHVMDRAYREGWLHDKAAWKRWMNDSENSKFRIWKGRM